MPPRARIPRLNPSDLPSLSLNDFVQLLVVTARHQVGQNRRHASSAAIEGQVRERQVTLPASAVRSLVNDSQAPQRKSRGHALDSDLATAEERGCEKAA